MRWFAHSAGADGKWQTLREHLENVAQLAAEFAERFDAADEARAAAWVHDIGKYSELFRERLRGTLPAGVKLDHSSPGAVVARKLWHNHATASASIAYGHHIGLGNVPELIMWLLGRGSLEEKDNLLRVKESADDLLQRAEVDGASLPSLNSTLFQAGNSSGSMLPIRMLFSCVVDADYLDTERHFNGPDARLDGPSLNPKRAIARVEEYLAELRAGSTASATVNHVREAVRTSCEDRADDPPGLFTLTAPTGSGKTLAMLLFALKHAAKHDLERIVFVLPYLSIIDQVAKELHDLFDPVFKPGYVLEHHSRVGEKKARERTDKPLTGEEKDRLNARQKQLAQNWDAPIVVTTSVQALESLFGNRPGPCRKLHRMAKAVLLFDEVQTLPGDLLLPTLGTIAELTRGFRSTVVFSTATQPAFDHLNGRLREREEPEWQPRELVPGYSELFARMKRVKVRWTPEREVIDWEQLADEIAGRPETQVLCIVNMRGHAQTLYKALSTRMDKGDLFHLSTTLCGGHRDELLKDVTGRLEKGRPCVLVSTQCIEAGVDISFPAVYRAHAPLEAIAQAAGRCNRHGEREQGEVVVFRPDVEQGRGFPSTPYEKAADVVNTRLALSGGRLDIDDPEKFRTYYCNLYDLTDNAKVKDELDSGIRGRDYNQVAQAYQMIPADTVQVLVAWEPAVYNAFADEARDRGLTTDWMKRAQAHSVAVYRHQADKLLGRLESIPIFAKGSNGGWVTGWSEEWFISACPEDYDEALGWIPEEGLDPFL